jgi:plasmid stabilization system protein ParE
MKVRLTPRAARDLADIADYIRERNPAAAQRVRAAIVESLTTLASFPHIGRRQDVEHVRKLVVRRYGYLIYYRANVTSQEIAILTIRHPSRRREYSDR